MTLTDFFLAHPKAALGFSGGVDSAYLLYAGLQAGAEVQPYFVKTAFQPRFELEDALRLGRALGVEISIIAYDILDLSEVAQNPAGRCYHCKKALFARLQAQAVQDGYAVLLDGTNASDDAGDRPGMQALRELSVLSPLRLCGLTKPEIRRRSKEAGLFTWDKPAYACLATRVPAGTELTAALLARIEGAEDALSQLGFSDFRVRVFHGAARLQLKSEQFPYALENRTAVSAAVKPWFDAVLLDLEGR